MRVGLKTGAGTEFWLAGQAGVSERDHSSAGNYQVAPQASQPTAGYVRAQAGRAFDRGNVLTRISFETTRIFASVELAELWVNDYERDFPREGTVILETVPVSDPVRRRYLLNAVVAPPVRRLRGVSVQLSYVITGGIIADNEEGVVLPFGAALAEDGAGLELENGNNLLNEGY